MSRLLLMMGAVLLAACDARSPVAPPSASAEAGMEVLFPVRVGMLAIHLRLATTELEKARGLMGTLQLKEGEGMAFFYEADQPMSFWMKDTPLDLDIAFVAADGKILEIKTMTAGDTETTASTSSQVRLAVEMSAHWFKRSGIKVGDRLNPDDLRRGLTARGFVATRYIP
ncbi:MAG: DUF192 domain-containing protein [Opitutales bacterium]|nr:MAG: DUF192 domain-containing protein [Opitutales bacterium]